MPNDSLDLQPQREVPPASAGRQLPEPRDRDSMRVHVDLAADDFPFTVGSKRCRAVYFPQGFRLDLDELDLDRDDGIRWAVGAEAVAANGTSSFHLVPAEPRWRLFVLPSALRQDERSPMRVAFGGRSTLTVDGYVEPNRSVLVFDPEGWPYSLAEPVRISFLPVEAAL